jgi:hypothetical protein
LGGEKGAGIGKLVLDLGLDCARVQIPLFAGTEDCWTLVGGREKFGNKKGDVQMKEHAWCRWGTCK